MSDISLIANDGSSDYVHNPMPSVVISSKYIHGDDTSTLKERTVEWAVTGYLIHKNGDIVEQVQALEAFYANAELLTLKIVDNDSGDILFFKIVLYFL